VSVARREDAVASCGTRRGDVIKACSRGAYQVDDRVSRLEYPVLLVYLYNGVRFARWKRLEGTHLKEFKRGAALQALHFRVAREMVTGLARLPS
jgi:hypothetical protein